MKYLHDLLPTDTLERRLLIALMWWAGGGVVLSFMSLVASEIIILATIWMAAGLVLAGAATAVAVYQLQQWLDQTKEELVQIVQPVPVQPAVLQQPSITTPQDVIKYGTDGVAIQFYEIFKEL